MHHDCVVVPGFGAFMINHEAARYDASAGIFLPPSRSLGFNPEVRHNDALLLGSISRREGISIEAARSALDNGLASLLHQMRMSGEVHIGRLGVFRQDGNTDLPVFEPAVDSLPLRALDGLQPLAINRLGFNDDEEEKVACADRQPVVIPFPLKIVASIVAVMVGLGILYSTTSLVNGPRVNFASLDTGISTHIERVIDSTVSVSREILLNIAMPPAEVETAAPQEAESIVADAEEPGRYLLVVASFPNEKTARRHIAQMADDSLRIIEMEGNYRIYAASASTINEARALAGSLSDRYPSVWVCRR